MIFKEALRSLKNSRSKAVFFALTFFITTALLFVYFNMAEAVPSDPEVYVSDQNLADMLQLLSKGNISNLMMVFVVIMCAIDLFFTNDFFVKNKAKELAVRMICGATYLQLAGYLLIQTMILLAVSIPLGILCGYGLLQVFNVLLNMGGAEITLRVTSYAMVEFVSVMFFIVGVITILNASFAYKSGAVLLAGGNISAMKKGGGYGVTNTKVFQFILNLIGIAAAVLPLYGFFKSSGGLAVMMVIACVGLERTISCVLLPALSRYNRKKGTASTVEAAANGFLRRDIQFTKITIFLLIGDLMVLLSMLAARQNGPVEQLMIIFTYISISILQSMTIMFRLETDLSSRSREYMILGQLGTPDEMRSAIMHREIRRFYLFVALLCVIYIGTALVSVYISRGASLSQIALLGTSALVPVAAVAVLTIIFYSGMLKNNKAPAQAEAE